MTPTDATLDALFADILANPADGALRLIYADALTDAAYERGEEDDPRAEFIRVQCELANPHGWKPGEWCGKPNRGDHCIRPRRKGGAGNQDCLWCRSERRERELFARHGDAWVEPLPEMLGRANTVSCLAGYDAGFGDDYNVLTVRRGFIAEITLPFTDWYAHGDDLVKATPLERVRVTGAGAEPHPIEGFYWFNAGALCGEIVCHHDLPSDIFSRLRDYLRCYHGNMAYYATRALALAAFTAACRERWKVRVEVE